MCLSIGATEDAERHYTNAIDYMSRNDGSRSDMLWMASALEGLAAADIAQLLVVDAVTYVQDERVVQLQQQDFGPDVVKGVAHGA